MSSARARRKRLQFLKKGVKPVQVSKLAFFGKVPDSRFIGWLKRIFKRS